MTPTSSLALEEVGISNDAHSHDAARFASLTSKLGIRIALAAGTHADILRSHEDRRKTRQEQLSKYFVLNSTPPDPNLACKAGFPSIRSPNDNVDLDVLTTLAASAADWLVTQDSRLRKRAVKAGFSERVFSLCDVLDTLDSLVSKPTGLNTVETVVGYQIDLTAAIFESLRADYKEFEEWWRTKVAKEHRDVLVLGSPRDPEGLAVLKIEDDQPHGLPGRVLKICTFKTSDIYHGSRRGELLLKAAIDYARRNLCERVYLEVLPCKEALLQWLMGFGFSIVKQSATCRGEHAIVKELAPSAASDQLSALEYNTAYGPGALRAEFIHLVPIRPQFHGRLFPEAEIQQRIFPRLEACGNSIRKAYLCHAKTRAILEGHALLFIRTRKNSSATAVGVAEATRVSRVPEEIMAFVGNRTVYSLDEMRRLCHEGNTLAILFRLDQVLTPPWPMSELQRSGVLTGNPQSIQRVRREAIEWIQQRLAG